MNNPLSDDPEFDLYPYPEGSTGHRLWKLLPDGTTRAQYLAAFDRRNLICGREWNAALARRAGRALLPELVGRTVGVLGSEVRSALGLPKVEPLSVQQTPVGGGGIMTWIAFPHPSGRNLWYNNEANRLHAMYVLERLMLGVPVDD